MTNLSAEQLRDIILEEFEKLDEGWLDRLKARTSGAASAVKGVGTNIGQAAKAAKHIATKGVVPPEVKGVNVSQQTERGKVVGLLTPKYKRLTKFVDDLSNDALIIGKKMKDNESASALIHATNTLKSALEKFGQTLTNMGGSAPEKELTKRREG